MDTKLRTLFENQVSRPYDEFRVQKNKLVNYLLRNYDKDFWHPTIETVKPYIKLTTKQEHFNIVMFICIWDPTFSSVAKEWIDCCIKAGISLDQKDIHGKTTQEYLSEYLRE